MVARHAADLPSHGPPHAPSTPPSWSAISRQLIVRATAGTPGHSCAVAPWPASPSYRTPRCWRSSRTVFLSLKGARTPFPRPDRPLLRDRVLETSTVVDCNPRVGARHRPAFGQPSDFSAPPFDGTPKRPVEFDRASRMSHGHPTIGTAPTHIANPDLTRSLTVVPMSLVERSRTCSRTSPCPPEQPHERDSRLQQALRRRRPPG